MVVFTLALHLANTHTNTSYAAHRQDLRAGDAERVLVDGDQAPVREESETLGPQSADVGRHEEGGGEHRPQRHLEALLDVTQAVVADDELR